MPITKATKVAQLLNNSTGFVKNTYVDSDAINTSASLGTASSASTTVYATLGDLPGSASTGAQAFVSSNSSLYIYNGSGWYKIALVNATPYWSSEASSSYTFTIDTAITITLLAGDSDGHNITYTATPDSDANLFITITKDSDNGRIFTLTPDSENEAPGTSNTGTVTFKASDSISFASTVSTFTLNFVNIIANSAETVLLMKAAGNSATNADITYQNSSDVSTGFTETDNPLASTFSPYRSGGYSTQFANSVAGNLNWSGTYLDSDYTIEAWIYTTEVDNSGYNNIISDQSSNVQLTLHNTSTGNITTVYGGAVKLGPTSTSTGLNEWVHFVWEREGTTIRHYANGALVGSGTADSNAFTISKIGQYYTGGWEHHGYIRDLRVLKSAKYGGSSYTVPTSTPAFSDDATTQFIACHLPYIGAEGVSISRTGTTFTSTAPFGPYDYEPWTAADGGSVYFDGNDYLTSATNLTSIAAGDYTVEFWVRPWNNLTDQQTILHFNAGSFGGTNIWYGGSSGANITVDNGTVGTTSFSNQSLVLNTWNHVAITRSSTTTTCYINGKSAGSHTYSPAASDRLYVGTYAAGTYSYYLDAYVADVRYVPGSVVYTSNFTPPTAPLSHVTNTDLLMNNKSDANIYDASSSYSLQLNGDTISSTTQRKFTTSSSMYFDGTGDYLTVNDGFHFGTGDFTFEFWLYPTENLTSAIQLFINGETTGSGRTWVFSTHTYGNFNGITFSYGQYGSYIVGKYANNVWPTQNAWTHLVAQRRNGTIEIYVNGTSQTLTTYNENSTFDDGADLTSNYTSRDFFNGLQGYVQDLRITKGAARYTSNFTPPTTEFEL